VQSTFDSPLLVTQYCTKVTPSVAQHIRASSVASCPGRSNDDEVGGGVTTTVIGPVVEVLGSDSLISTMDDVAAAGACVPDAR
jgi:hypothetical protein